MANIITSKKTGRRSMGAMPNAHNGKWSKAATEQFHAVSKENKDTFKKEKMVQELANQGFNEAAISGMTTLRESSVKSMMKKTGKNIHLDGQY